MHEKSILCKCYHFYQIIITNTSFSKNIFMFSTIKSKYSHTSQLENFLYDKVQNSNLSHEGHRYCLIDFLKDIQTNIHQA